MMRHALLKMRSLYNKIEPKTVIFIADVDVDIGLMFLYPRDMLKGNKNVVAQLEA